MQPQPFAITSHFSFSRQKKKQKCRTASGDFFATGFDDY
jgi:hypothetical protein